MEKFPGASEKVKKKETKQKESNDYVYRTNLVEKNFVLFTGKDVHD